MAKKQTKLKWTDTEELTFRLIDQYPNLDPTRLSPDALIEHVISLPDFGEKRSKPDRLLLEDLQTRWFEERSDMEDELGPLEEPAGDGEELDEDAYREDRMIEDEDEEEESFSEPYDEDDEEEDED